MIDTRTLPEPRMNWSPVVSRGPICGYCKARHLNVTAIRDCYDAGLRYEADLEQIAAEHAAELAAERWHEDRGWDAARADEAIEAARGVIPFHEAYAAALA